GKTLLARAYHRMAKRTGPFISFDCATGSDGMRSSDLLGASDAATGSERGQLSAARNGTLVLDSVFDLPALVQRELVEFFERRARHPGVTGQPTELDVAIIATTESTLGQRSTERAE